MRVPASYSERRARVETNGRSESCGYRFGSSSRHVAEDRRIWTRNSPQQPVRLRTAIELEALVDTGCYEIETRQYIVRIVEGPVGEDVALDSLEDPEVLSEALIEPVGLAMLLSDDLDRQSPGVMYRLRMVSDAEIPEASFARGFRHRIERFIPSDAAVLQCRMPYRSSSATSLASLPFRANSISPRPSRSSGSINGRPSAQ